jgi:hypothetical protein
MPQIKGKSKPKGKSKRKASKGRRVRSSEGTSLVQSGRAVVTPSNQPMIPFRNSGLITPPPLMQVPSGLTRMSQMGIPASMFGNDPMSTGYFQAAPQSVQQQVQAGWSPLYKAQAEQQIQAREQKQRTAAEELKFRKKMTDLDLDPNNPNDVNLYYQYESEEAQKRLEEFEKKEKDKKMNDVLADQISAILRGADIGQTGLPMNEDEKYDKAAQPDVSSSSTTPMGPVLNPVEQNVLTKVEQNVLNPAQPKKRKANQEDVLQPSNLDLSNQLVVYNPLPLPAPVPEPVQKRPKSRPNPVYALEYDPNED